MLSTSHMTLWTLASKKGSATITKYHPIASRKMIRSFKIHSNVLIPPWRNDIACHPILCYYYGCYTIYDANYQIIGFWFMLNRLAINQDWTTSSSDAIIIYGQ